MNNITIKAPQAKGIKATKHSKPKRYMNTIKQTNTIIKSQINLRLDLPIKRPPIIDINFDIILFIIICLLNIFNITSIIFHIIKTLIQYSTYNVCFSIILFKEHM